MYSNAICKLTNDRQFFMKNKCLEEVIIFITEVCSEPCQISKMERFAKIVNGYQQGSEYTSILQ